MDIKWISKIDYWRKHWDLLAFIYVLLYSLPIAYFFLRDSGIQIGRYAIYRPIQDMTPFEEWYLEHMGWFLVLGPMMIFVGISFLRRYIYHAIANDIKRSVSPRKPDKEFKKRIIEKQFRNKKKEYVNVRVNVCAYLKEKKLLIIRDVNHEVIPFSNIESVEIHSPWYNSWGTGSTVSNMANIYMAEKAFGKSGMLLGAAASVERVNRYRHIEVCIKLKNDSLITIRCDGYGDLQSNELLAKSAFEDANGIKDVVQYAIDHQANPRKAKTLTHSTRLNDGRFSGD